MTEGPDPWVEAQLLRLQQQGLRRDLRSLTPVDSVHATRGTTAVTLFATNDYLGLSDHPEVKRAISDAALDFGNGPRGSPLICGYSSFHEALEHQIAQLVNAKSALLFPTGYSANLATIATVSDETTEIFSDRLNHASIIDGCRMARRNGATLSVYPHQDVGHLAQQLKASKKTRKLIVTESVFSMDGDLAPLREIAALGERHGAQIMVDESHATLVFGENGEGLTEALGLSDGISLRVGTLSKAAGGLGGFVACGPRVKELLLNRGRPFVFSTALPLPCVAGLLAALRIGQKNTNLRASLWSRVRELESGLGLNLKSPICPVIVGPSEQAMRISQALWDQGIYVQAIRPPTVPKGTSRLRVTVCAKHHRQDVEQLLKALDLVRAQGLMDGEQPWVP